MTLFLLSGLLIGGCSDKMYEKITEGIIVHVKNPDKTQARLVRLNVLGDKLIYVSATPDRTFRDSASLAVLPVTQKTSFEVQQRGDTVCVLTKDVIASVLASTGEVWFTDRNGNLYLREHQGGGKTFIPIEMADTHGYTIRQQFESPGDEAFYGLGQHQADEFNYKDKNEELFQYNTKISIPFIVSNKNYGLYLDSYALSRFGNSNDYLQLNRAFKLYDKEGKAGGLTGIYVDKDGKQLVRTEDSLYFENKKMVKFLPKDFPLQGSNVIYEGSIEPVQTGMHQFILYYAGYVKVFVDNREVVAERWRTAWNPNSYKFAVNFEKGKKVPLRIEWKPDGDESYCGLRAYLPLSDTQQNKQIWWTEMAKQLNYYFIAGNNMDEIISGYRTLTGKSPIMPKWAMGFWQSRERYNTSEELLGVLKEFRQRQIPIDNIVQDWFYWKENDWGSHRFDKTRYPNPKAMVDSIHALNARIMVSVWPKFYITTDHYKAFAKEGWMYQQSVKDSLRDWVGKGYHYAFYDAYNADARKLFWKQMKEYLYPLGVDAWWMDASEPNVMDCTDIDYRKALCGPTALGSSTEFFNAYALMNAEAIYNGQRSADPNKRVFLLTRSGFAGLQRYSTVTWSGDIATRWEDMKAQISAGLNFAISGIPYWTMDIGGFCVENRYVQGQQAWNQSKHENADYKEWRELNTRWYQFGAFCPLYRAHGQYPFREIWNIAPKGHPAYESVVYYTRLRYHLMPYIYSLAGMTYLNDYTIMRPLVMDFANDPHVTNIGDSYLFGPSLLVAPVYTYGARKRELYFPQSAGWYDFYSGRYYAGGEQRQVDAPYERIPLFVKAGSILPVGVLKQSTAEGPDDVIRLYVYQGANADFTLYEDEGVNYNYEKGAYATIPLHYDEATKTLTIGARKGFFEGMLKQRKFVVVKVDANHPQTFQPDVAGEEVLYDGAEKTIRL